MIFLLLPTVDLLQSTPLSPRIPPFAWCGIAILILFTLAVNIAMIALLRAKTPPGKAKRQLRAGGLIGDSQDLTRMGQVLRDPFAKERAQLDELSRLIHGLEEPTPPQDPGQPTIDQDMSSNKK